MGVTIQGCSLEPELCPDGTGEPWKGSEQKRDGVLLRLPSDGWIQGRLDWGQRPGRRLGTEQQGGAWIRAGPWGGGGEHWFESDFGGQMEHS